MRQLEEDEEEEGRLTKEERRAQRRGDPQGKGGDREKLYSWRRADDIQEGHGVRKMSREIERFGGEELTLKTSLDLFSFIEMFSSQGPNNKNMKGKLHLLAENEGMLLPELY